MVRKEGDKFVLYSKDGKVLGRSKTREGIDKRERQVQYFKHLDSREKKTSAGE